MIEVRLLRQEDDRSRFRSGQPDLDRFFARYAGQNQFRHHIGSTYVAVEGGEILGFMTVSPAQIAIDHLPAAQRKRLPHYPLPVLRLARLAVAEPAQGQGIGRLLLRVALRLTREMSAALGGIGLVVDAKPEAVTFYRRYGFEPLDVLEGSLGDCPEPVSMFLPMSSIPDGPIHG